MLLGFQISQTIPVYIPVFNTDLREVCINRVIVRATRCLRPTALEICWALDTAQEDLWGLRHDLGDMWGLRYSTGYNKY